MKTVVMLIVVGLMTTGNVVIVLTYKKRVQEWYEALLRQHKLNEFEKRRMCNSYCKFKEAAKTEEELEWECANCPVANLQEVI